MKLNLLPSFYEDENPTDINMSYVNAPVENIPITEEGFSIIDTGDDLGYYKGNSSGMGIGFTRLTNFTIELDECIKYEREGKPISIYNGRLLLSDGSVIPFKNLESNGLTDPKTLELFCTNLGGTKIQFFTDNKRILQSVKYFNRNIPIRQAQDFGYDHNLTEYVSENLKITKDGIMEHYTPMKHPITWDGKELGFQLEEALHLEEVKQSIINDFMSLDSHEVIYTALAFAMLPLIHPFVRNVMPNRPYLMLKGPSGCGKTFLSTMIQRLFGKYDNLTGWSSTDASLTILGNAHKDTLFAVDDFKQQNFPSERDRRKAMRTIQNYADNYARNRANINMNLRDEYKIRGFLLISAEDLVITEASTLARGIIVNMESKSPNHQLTRIMEKASKKYNVLTPYFILHLLRKLTVKDAEKMFAESNEAILKIIETLEIEVSNDNLSRIANNFALLQISWSIFSEFLTKLKSQDESAAQLEKMKVEFNTALKSLLSVNLERVQNYKPEMKFQETLWALVEDGILSFQDLDSPNSYCSGKIIGWFTRNRNNKNNFITNNRFNPDIKIGINMTLAYKEIENYLLSEGGIGVSKDTLIAKLTHDQNIIITPSQRISFSQELKKRGVEWTGNFPAHLFGFIEIEESIDKKEDDLLSNVEKDADSPFFDTTIPILEADDPFLDVDGPFNA